MKIDNCSLNRGIREKILLRILMVVLTLALAYGCGNAVEQTNDTPAPQQPTGEKPRRVQHDVILLYQFNEGSDPTIFDSSGYVGTDAAPLDMDIFDVTKVNWITGGLHITGPVQIKTFDGVLDHFAGKLQSAVESTEEFTLEAWLKPENITQGFPFPACIFAFSGDTTTHNFMLAQQEDSYVVDFRTTDTNIVNNNTKGQPSLLGPVGSASTQITHVVITWSNAAGEINLYINGQWAQSLPRSGKVLQGWESTLPLRLGYELDPFGSLVNTWKGDVYFIALYNRLLSEDEIYQNYQAGYDGTV